MKKKFKGKKDCMHRNIEDLKEYRTNYNFGKKSTPIKTFKKIWGRKCKDCGLVIKVKNNGRTKI